MSASRSFTHLAPWLLLLGGVALLACPARAQRCGNELTAADAAMALANEEAGLYTVTARTEAQLLCRLATHVVIQHPGAQGVSQSILDWALDNTNEYFLPTGIQFIVSVQDTIYSEELNVIDTPQENSALRLMNIVPDAINIYYVAGADFCGESSFSWFTENRGIIMVNGCTDDNGILAHEVGHYFDLFHTHETAFGAECPDGSNCATAGDRLCDTPADGNLWAGCAGVGSIFCNGGTRAYTPDGGNIMSYAPTNCLDHFSADQMEKAVATYLNLRPELYLEAPDLVHVAPFTWTSGALVPRGDATGQPIYTVVSPTLPGNSAATWISRAGYNQGGEALLPYVVRTTLDNQLLETETVSDHPGETVLFHMNSGPYTVRGGRHALIAYLDDNDVVPEANEGNNRLATQWIWSPTALGVGVSLLADSPPDRMSASFIYPNCDGYQFQNAAWWEIIAVQPASLAADYDLRLHNDYVGSTTGFAAQLATSTYGFGQPDWLIVNRNLVGTSTWQVGVTNYSNTGGGMRVQRDGSLPHALADGLAISDNLAAGRFVDIREIYVGAEDLGIDWWFNLASPDPGDLDMALYDKTLQTGGRNSGVLQVSEVQGTSTQRFYHQFSQSGYYALVIHKDDAIDLPLHVGYTLTVTRARADLAFGALDAGLPFLPRPMERECGLLPSPLETGPTVVDVAVANAGRVSAMNGWNLRLLQDGATRSFSSNYLTILPPGAGLTWCGITLGTVTGGRHEIGVQLDLYNEVDEDPVDNNLAYRQFVWEPQPLASGVPLVQSPPPNRVNSNNPAAAGLPGDNQDGFRAGQGVSMHWMGVACVSHGGQDSLRLSGYAAGSGLLQPLVSANPVDGKVALVAAYSSSQSWDFGVCNRQAWPEHPSNGNYSIEANDLSLGAGGNNQVSAGVLGPGRLVDSYYCSLFPGNDVLIQLRNSSEANLAVALFRPQTGLQGLDQALLVLDTGGAGEDEGGHWPVTAQGFYGILVYKTGWSDLNLSGAYELVVGNSSILPIDDLSITLVDADLSDRWMLLDLDWSTPRMFEESSLPAIVDHYELYQSEHALAPFPGPDWFHWDNTTTPGRPGVSIWSAMANLQLYFRVVAVNPGGTVALAPGEGGMISVEELHRRTSRVRDFGQPMK